MKLHYASETGDAHENEMFSKQNSRCGVTIFAICYLLIYRLLINNNIDRFRRANVFFVSTEMNMWHMFRDVTVITKLI